LPPDGKLHFTTITVSSNATLRFGRNALNTPVYLLAKGDVIIDGTIDVSGKTAGTNAYVGGDPGPGGFVGGAPGYLIQAGPPVTARGGNGLGPGGGKPEYTSGGGPGCYAYNALNNPAAGQSYGFAHLIPLIGGSGGAGASNSITGGGGGGGGAVLIASNTRIQVNGSGRILANGGAKSATGNSGPGSGGAIRLVAPMVLGTGVLDVTEESSTLGNPGRIRIDSVLRYDPTDPTNPTNQFNISTGTTGVGTDARVWSVGTTMIVFPTNQPRLDIVGVGTNAIPQGTNNGVMITLPFNANTNQAVTVRATDFNANVPIRVVVTPENGYVSNYDTLAIDNSAGGSTDGQVNVVMPLNLRAYIHVWTR
jgi:hypothetical protein